VTGVPNHDLKPSTHHLQKDPSEKEKKEKSKAEKSLFFKMHYLLGRLGRGAVKYSQHKAPVTLNPALYHVCLPIVPDQESLDMRIQGLLGFSLE